jgi:hypothetical protein
MFQNYNLGKKTIHETIILSSEGLRATICLKKRRSNAKYI